MLGQQILLGLCAASVVFGAPLLDERQATSKCVNAPVRRAWHTLSDGEKKAYLDAELCLMKKPATLGLRGARTKFDELQAVHVSQAMIAHFVGQFFPFHRLYVWAHEQSLRKECGYTGAQPYWDETHDVASFSKSDIFKSELGFGGNGVRSGNTSCIKTGPFANYTNPIGPGYRLQDHCINRWMSDMGAMSATKSVVDGCLAKKNYLDFWNCVETGPHGAGHAGVGADMVNPISSPGDPIFYLHHTWLDRMWAQWQAQNPAVRLKEIGGNNKPNTTVKGGLGGPFNFNPSFDGMLFPPVDRKDLILPADIPEPQVIGDPGSELTLNHLIQMYGIVPNQTVAEVMDIQGGVLCYGYD